MFASHKRILNPNRAPVPKFQKSIATPSKTYANLAHSDTSVSCFEFYQKKIHALIHFSFLEFSKRE